MNNQNNQVTMRFQRPRDLEADETSSSLEHWMNQLEVYLKRDPAMSIFLEETWNPAAQHYGLEAKEGFTQEQMEANCKIFLGHICSFFKYPYYNHLIKERSTNMESIYDILREIYHIEKDVSSFTTVAKVKKNSTESYAVFYAKIVYLMEQNLAPAGKTVKRITTPVGGDKMSVSLLDHAALLWLIKIDPRLVDKVDFEFASQIKEGKRLSELVPQISKNLPTMLKKLEGPKGDALNCIQDLNVEDGKEEESDDAECMNVRFNRARGNQQRGRGNDRLRRGGGRQPPPKAKPVCTHCNWLKTFWQISEVDDNHRTEACQRKIPKDVRSIIEREVTVDTGSEDDPEESGGESKFLHLSTSIPVASPLFQMDKSSSNESQPSSKAQDRRIRIRVKSSSKRKSSSLSDTEVAKLTKRAVRLIRKATSPKLLVTFNNNRSILLIDEGSELNCMDADYAVENDVRLEPSKSSAKAAGNSELSILGQTVDDIYVDTKFQSHRISINLGKVTVIKNLGASLLLGEPGKASNSITTDPKKRIIIAEREGRFLMKPYLDADSSTSTVCRVEERRITVFPDEALELEVPEHLQFSEVVVTPRREYSHLFSPTVTYVEDKVALSSISNFPINLKKHDQVADIRSTIITDSSSAKSSAVRKIIPHTEDRFKFDPTVKKSEPPDISAIKVDPDGQLSQEARRKFQEVNKKYEALFTSTPGRYTGFYGDIDTSLHFVQPPVQTRKVAVPNYNREMQEKLGAKMDELIDAGILMTPAEVGVSIEFVSPSQLVPKLEAGKDRLVSDFTHLNRFIKRRATTSPSISEAKSELARKRYFVEIDLSNYFFQGGLRREDCAYLAIQHPFKGPYVYTASPQGLKNSSEISYDRLARVYGDMIQQRKMTRMADGLYPIGDDEEELLANYEEVLRRAEKSGFTFKPSKTIVAPRKTTVFGWTLEDGRWSPQPHVISSLSRSEKPTTVKQMRSFLGSYKQVSECVPNYSVLLSDLEQVVGSRGSSERINWTPELEKAFEDAKKAVTTFQGVYVPTTGDRLITSSDYSHQEKAVGGLLTIIRKIDGKEVKLLGGYFSVKLEKNKHVWLPCEGEALGVKLTLLHFENYIRENPETTIHYTDSMPVTQAWRRMTTGRFSTCPRISAFLSTLASFPVRVEHRPGSSMALVDHASRHPPPSCKGECAICKYVSEEQTIGDRIRHVVTDDEIHIEENDDKEVPFLQLKTWRHLQQQDGVHTKLMKLIKTGQEPERKRTGGLHTTLKHLHTLFQKDNVVVHKSGVIMVRTVNGKYDGYAISVPQSLHHAIAYSFHQRLDHPKKTQLIKFLSRYFFMTAMPTVVDQVSSSCLRCLSTLRLPKALIPDSTSIPEGFGRKFTADVLERNNQCLFICKEILSQFTSAVIIPDQTAASMKEAIVQTVAPYISLEGAELKLDAASAFQSLEKNQDTDPVLKDLKLKLIIGHPLNVNKNPSGESTVAEIKRELLHLANHNSPITQATLSLAARNLNNRVRSSGRSAKEMLTMRDTLSNGSVEISDAVLKEELTERRKEQHLSNEKRQSKSKVVIPHHEFKPGDVVMYRDLPDYNKPRDTFVVVSQEDDWVTVRKMSNQLRMKTYQVRREKLVLVFSPEVPRVPAGPKIPENLPPVKDDTATTSKEREKEATRENPSRTAKKKARMALSEQSLAKVIRIQRKFNKKRKSRQKNVTWDYLVYTPPRQFQDANPPQDDQHQGHDNDQGHEDDGDSDHEEIHQQDVDENWNILPFHDVDTELESEHSEVNTTDYEDYHSVFDSSEYGSPPISPTQNHDNAFLMPHSPPNSPLSVCTMSPTSRSILIAQLESSSNSSDEQSLTWDNDPSLVDLSNALSLEVNVSEQDGSYSPNWDSLESSEAEEDDSVFEASFRSSTPHRITRSMTSSGEYESSLSPIPFVRNSNLRRPVVRWQQSVPEIVENSRQENRRRQPALAPSSSQQ